MKINLSSVELNALLAGHGRQRNETFTYGVRQEQDGFAGGKKYLIAQVQITSEGAFITRQDDGVTYQNVRDSVRGLIGKK